MKKSHFGISNVPFLGLGIAILLSITACVSPKKYDELEAKQRETQDQLHTAVVKLNSAIDTIDDLKNRNSVLANTNSGLAIQKDQKESKYSNLETDYKRLNEEYENLQSEIDYLSSLPRTESNKAMLAAKDLELIEKQREIDNLEVQKIKKELDQAELSYYCPKEVLEGEEFSIAVIVSKILERNKLEDTLSKRLKFSDITIDEREVSDLLTSASIEIGDSLKVWIEFNESHFEEIVSEKDTIREIGKELEEWNWRLRAKSAGKQRSINIIVKSLNKNKWREDLPPKVFKVDVTVDTRSYLYKLWEFVQENPEWPIATLILPVISFFAGEWRERRKRKKS